MKKWIAGMLIMVAGTALSASVWTGAASSDWFDAGNWTGSVPANGAPQDAQLFVNNLAVIANGDAAVSLLYVGLNGSPAALQVDSGSLTNSGAMLLGYSNHRSGSYTQNGGSVSIVGMQASRDANCPATMTISDGTFSASDSLVLGKKALTTYVQTGGSVSTDVALLLGTGLNGAVDMTLTDGSIAVGTVMNIGTGTGSSSILRVNGGTLDIVGDYNYGGLGIATNILNGGNITVGGQLVKKGAGTTFTFNSGTLSVYDMAWNGDLSVGNGTDSATLILQANAAEHVVNANVLEVNNNAHMYGAGTLVGGAAGKRVGVKAGGVISAGEGEGQIGTFTIGLNQALVLGDLSGIEFEADSSSADLISVSGTLSFVSNSTVTVALTDLGGADFSQEQVLLTYENLVGFDLVTWDIDASGVGGTTFRVVNDATEKQLVLTPVSSTIPAVSLGEYGNGQDVINWTTIPGIGLVYGVYYTTDLQFDFMPLETNLVDSVQSWTNDVDASTIFYKVIAE